MPEQTDQIKMDTQGLYREDVFTDRQVGTIRRLTPVTATGEDDASRPVQYIGSAQIMTPAGALPLTFELEASSLEEAANQFAKGAEEAMQATMEELKEMQRQAASSIVVPKGGMDPMGGGGMPGGGIQMP